jgi:sulfate adenylyltransferase
VRVGINGHRGRHTPRPVGGMLHYRSSGVIAWVATRQHSRMRQLKILIPPHGGRLVNLVVDGDRATELRATSRAWPSWELTPRQVCDLELLSNGGFSPLNGYMTRPDYESVCDHMRLADDTLWPIPVTLDVPEVFARALSPGKPLALRDPEGVMMAVLHVEEIWKPDRGAEAASVYGTTSLEHPGVKALDDSHHYLVGGPIESIQLPVHYDFQALRHTPLALRTDFAATGWHKVVAFQSRNPMHRAHQALTLQAASDIDARLLLHPVVGATKPGDVDHYTRVRCYQAVLPTYPPGVARLSLLPLAMRMAGPREALWHAIIRKNFGCTHLIVGRDHAGPGCDTKGRPFYGPYEAQELLRRHDQELGVGILPFRELMYANNLDRYIPDDLVPQGSELHTVSGTALRRMLNDGADIPEWFTFPAVARELRRGHPPRAQRGFTVFFTGLSGAGKSTIANVLLVRLLEMGGRPVTLLDGDIVRKHLSSELGFSKEHRDINVRRIGFVASEITKNGGIALCAPIAPFDAARRDVRTMIEAVGGFALVHVATPIAVCEQRDGKGLYAKARAGLLPDFTGVSQPYEPPLDAELVIDTSDIAAAAAADIVLDHLRRQGYLPSPGTHAS